MVMHMNELTAFIAAHPILIFAGLATAMLLLATTLWWAIQNFRLPLYQRSASTWHCPQID